MLELSPPGEQEDACDDTTRESEALIAMLNPMLRPLAQRGAIRSYKKNSVVINEG
jgi:hypothetical protein